MRKSTLIFLTLFLALSLALVACGGDEAEPEELTPDATLPTDPTVPPPAAGTTVDAITGTAFVEAINVARPGAGATEVQVTVRGNLNDACTHLEAIDVTDVEGNTFQVSIRTTRETDAICTQALVPFEETFTIDVSDRDPGTYTVEVDGESATFILAAVSEVTATPAAATATPVAATATPVAATASPVPTASPAPTATPAASLQVSPASAAPGASLQLSGSGYPANSTVDIGTGPLNSEYEIFASVPTDAQGNLNSTVALPAFAEPGQSWVLVADWDGNTVISNPISVTGSNVNVPVDGLFTRTQIYLIALEDAGQAGQEIGCGDSIVPVEVEIEPTIAPLRAALEELLAVDDEYYGQSGLYNALYRSDLQVQGIDIVNGEAIIDLSGELLLGGACDNPRVEAQLAQTALQFSTVNAVTIRLNGTPLAEFLSGQ